MNRIRRTGGSPVVCLGIVLLIFCVTACGGGGSSGFGPGGREGNGQGENEPSLNLTSVTPDSGPISGGEHVVISGTGFSPGLPTTVSFGGIPAFSIVVVDSETINKKGYYPPVVAKQGECHGCRLCELLCPEFAIFIVNE